MAQYDLTIKMCSFLDRHLVFPLLEFLSEHQIFDVQDIMTTKLELLDSTNMVDFAAEIYRQLYGVDKIPASYAEKREQVVNSLQEMNDHINPIVGILEKDEVQNQLQSSRDRDGKQLLELLVKNYDFHPDMLNLLYEFAKFKYDCGGYQAAAEYLYYYRVLVPSQSKHYLSSFWGKLASEILNQQWDVAREEMNKLKAHLDNVVFDNELEGVQQRAWLMHWGLFVYFNHPKGRDDIIDLFLYNQNYMNAMQIVAPHLLRYLTCAVVVNKKRRQNMKDLVKVIQLESQNYRDPITEFIECLFINYDFDGAQSKLQQCEEVLNNDFFLVACVAEFIECARQLIFECFCRIHQCISIKNLAQKLNMPEDEAERWIVNLIRLARLDAKIDSKMGHVIMGQKASSIYESVVESTKMLTFRAQSLGYQIEKLQHEKQGQQQWHAKAGNY